MLRGLDSVAVEVEADPVFSSCPLVLSLIVCLQEAGPGSPAVPHIESALLDLGVHLPAGAILASERRSSAEALAAYLEFLLPELRMQSPRAALSARWAADALRGLESERTGKGIQ
jgi:hypothetical protein